MTSYRSIPYVVYVPFYRGSFLREVSVRYVGDSAGLAKYIEITISGMENMPQLLN